MNETELTGLAAAWARMGVWLSVPPAADLIDLEHLIVESARLGRDDERLFVGAASWLAVHHGFVNGRRLSGLVAKVPPIVSATAGVLFSLARTTAGKAPHLDAALARCRPIRPARPLYTIVEQMKPLWAGAAQRSTPLFRRWGLWHDDESLKLSAIRPASWLIAQVPELRARALLGPSLEADLLARALISPLTARDLSRTLGVSYAAAHQTADHLVDRGLLVRERAGPSQLLVPSAAAAAVRVT